MNDIETVVFHLKRLSWHVSFAESCTAGLAAATLVDVAGASSVFDASFVTYANEAKTRLVGVRSETLAAHGAVSEQTAYEMANGCALTAGAEIGVGISGIAGPDGGTAEKPVGTVCFGFRFPDGTRTFTAYFGNIGRTAVRQAAVRYVFAFLAEALASYT